MFFLGPNSPDTPNSYPTNVNLEHMHMDRDTTILIITTPAEMCYVYLSKYKFPQNNAIASTIYKSFLLESRSGMKFIESDVINSRMCTKLRPGSE